MFRHELMERTRDRGADDPVYRSSQRPDSQLSAYQFTPVPTPGHSPKFIGRGEVGRDHSRFRRFDGFGSFLLGPIPDDVVSRAADAYEVGRAVAVDVAAAEVLRG